MSLPIDTNMSSKLAYSIWFNKPKRNWGLYYHANSQYKPEKYIDVFTLSNLRVLNYPDFTSGDEVFALYKSYVLATGRSDFPLEFMYAGTFAVDKNVREVTLLSNYTEWLFENEPPKSSKNMLAIFLKNDFRKFISSYVIKNHFFTETFYKRLMKELETFYEEYRKDVITNERPLLKSDIEGFESHLFYINHFIKSKGATIIAWLNNFRHFYCPGMLYSLMTTHLQQVLVNKKEAINLNELPLTLAKESDRYPKEKTGLIKVIKPTNSNKQYFPFIENQVKEMIENATDITLYDFAKLQKIYKKAVAKDEAAIAIVLKWVSFEIIRESVGFEESSP
jgi:hypothetical protein